MPVSIDASSSNGSATVELQPAEFDICGPLPSGVTVLEASAGTGKTYTIASLAARYVATGSRSNACCSSRSHGSPPASCVSACASGW